MMQPPCKKCLLSDMDTSDVKSEILGMIDKMPSSEKALPEKYDMRLDICRTCDSLNEGTCLKCGCYVELRAAKKKGSCPIKKW